MAALGFGPLVWVLRSERRPLRSPMVLLGGAYFLGTFLHVIYWVLWVGEPPTELLVGATPADWLLSVTSIVLWLAFTSAAYLLFGRNFSYIYKVAIGSQGRKSYSRTPQYLKPYYLVSSLLVCVVSLLGLYLVLRASGASDLEDLILRPVAKRRTEVVTADGGTAVGGAGAYRLLSSFAGPTSALLFAHTQILQRRETALKIVIAVFFLITMLTSLLLGGRTEVALTVLVYMLIYVWRTPKVNYKSLCWALAAVVLLVVGAGVQRAAGNRGAEGRGSITQNAVVEEFISGRSWVNPTVLAPVYVAVPERVEYQLGGTYGRVLIAPIPRELWPEKPGVRVGPAYGPRIYGFSNRVTGTPLGLVGEAYLNFGMLGIPLSAFVLGGVLRHVRMLIDRVESMNAAGVAALAYVAVALALRLPGGDFVGVAITTLRSVLIIGLASKVLLVQQRREVRVVGRSELAAWQLGSMARKGVFK